MKKLTNFVAAAVLALPAMVTQATADLADILSAGTIKIARPESFAPFGSLGASGEYEGYDVDVAKLIASDLGVELELVPVTSNQRIPFLETDRVDLVIATMGANPERAKSIWFSSAYAPFFSGAFAASGKSIAGVSDLAGMSVGLTGGTLEDLELTKIAPDTTEIIRFGDNAATRAAFESGQVDVLVSGNTVAAAISAANQDADIETKFILKESPAFIGVKKGNLDLLFWVNTFILHKTLGGDLNGFSNTWIGQDLPMLPSL
jgi:polar amino acid transport system substrate-binding protein